MAIGGDDRSATSPKAGKARRRGVLFLVMGPSGAGKDTLIDHVRERRPDIFFARRIITRHADAGGEEHEAVSPDVFDAQERTGGFALSWRAHGLAYGIPATLSETLASGRSALASVSRSVVDDARRDFQPLRLLLVTAPPEILATRLATRGRESVVEIEARLARAARDGPSGPDVDVIDNSGSIGSGVAAMLGAIEAAIGPLRGTTIAPPTPSRSDDTAGAA